MAPVPAAAFVHSGNPTTAPAVTLGTTAADDILIAVVTTGSGSSGPTLGGTYGGGAWTSIDSGTWGASDGAGAVYWSRCTGNHTGQTVTATTVNSGSLAVERITGAATSGSPIAGSTGANTTLLDGSLTGFTSTADDCLICLAVMVDDNQAVSGQTMNGSAMTERFEAGSTGGLDSLVGLATITQTTAGATGDFAITNVAGTAQGKRLTAFAVKPVVLTPVGDLSDDFADNSIDGAKWGTTAGVAETGGRMVVTASSSYPWFRAVTATYTLKDSAMFAPIPVRASGAGTAFTFRDDGNTNGWYFDISSDGNLYMYERVASVDSSTSITYSGTDHLWLRLRHDTTAGLVYWETSPDGEAWTTRRSKTPGLAMSLSGYRPWGYAGGATPSGTSEFESFNIPSSTTVSKNGSDAGTTSETSALVLGMFDDDDSDLSTEGVSVLLVQYARTDSGTLTEGTTGVADQTSKSATEAATFTEGAAALTDQTSKAVTEGFTIVEPTPALSQGRTVTEAFVLTEAGVVAATLSVAEAHAVSEALSLSAAHSASDALTLTDASAVSEMRTLSVVDTFLWAESLTLSALLSRVDSNTLTEVLTVAAALGVTDSVTWADVAAVANSTFFNPTDSATQADASALLTALEVAASETHSLSDLASLSAALSAADANTLSELVTILSTPGASDALAMADASVVTSNTFFTPTDSATQTDASTVLTTLAVLAAETHTVSDSALLSAALAAVDSAVQAEAMTLSAALTRTDSAAVTDASSLIQSVAKAGSDSLTLSEVAAASIALQRSDSGALTDLGAVNATQAIAAFDNLVWVAEQSLLGVTGVTPDIDRPTRAAVVAWAATAVLEAINLGVEVELHAATVVLAGNIKTVTIAPSMTYVAINPNRTSVSLG